MVEPSCVTNKGHTMFLDHRDSLFLSKDGCHDPQITCLLEQFVSEGGTFVDVGAHIGYYTVIASDLVGKTGKVFAFEPDPTNFALLKKNIAVNGCENVIAVQKAVSNTVGTTKLYISPVNTGDNMTCDDGLGWESIDVKTTTIDEYFKSYNAPISFVKLDVQGDESNVFDGMHKTIQHNDDIILIVEYCSDILSRDISDSLRWWAELGNILYFVYMQTPPPTADPNKDLFPVHLTSMCVDDLVKICDHFSSCIDVLCVKKPLEE